MQGGGIQAARGSLSPVPKMLLLGQEREEDRGQGLESCPGALRVGR